MFSKIITDLSFISSLLGFVGIAVITGYNWFLNYRLTSIKDVQAKKVETTQDQEQAKLDATKLIQNLQNKHDSYVAKLSSRVFFTLATSFVLSTLGTFMSIEEKSDIDKRVSVIEEYLWPPSGPGGGKGTYLLEKVNSIEESLLRVEQLQTKIIDTIYERVQSPSDELKNEVEKLTNEINFLKAQIDVTKRQQGGTQGATM